MGVLPTVNAASNNPREFCLFTGEPFASPSIGALHFLSNRRCRPDSLTTGDVALVLFNGATGQVRMKPDPNILTTDMNGLNYGSSLISRVYFVERGASC